MSEPGDGPLWPPFVYDHGRLVGTPGNCPDCGAEVKRGVQGFEPKCRACWGPQLEEREAARADEVARLAELVHLYEIREGNHEEHLAELRQHLDGVTAERDALAARLARVEASNAEACRVIGPLRDDRDDEGAGDE